MIVVARRRPSWEGKAAMISSGEAKLGDVSRMKNALVNETKPVASSEHMPEDTRAEPK